MAARTYLLGKLPAHGDFVSRGLDPAERDGWDAWAAAALDALRARAGPDFDSAHSAAPAWRFVAPCGAAWGAGALAPSVDRVGRRYLLLLGVDGLAPEVAGAAGLAVADAAEAMIYGAIAGGTQADALLAAAAERFADLRAAAEVAAPALAATPRGAGAWWTLGSPDCPPAAVTGEAPPADLFARTCVRAPTGQLEPAA